MSNTIIDDLTSTVYNDVLEEILSDSAIEGVYEYFKGRFKEILLSKEFDIKIFMARKAYALYAVFEEALRKELADEGEKPYGIIIHDRAFGLYANQLSGAIVKAI